MMKCSSEIKNDNEFIKDEAKVERSYRGKASWKNSNGQQLKSRFLSLRFKIKLLRKILIVILYSWLFLNVDPVYTRRTLANMVESRILHRSLLGALTGNRGDRSEGNGMSNAEAIALVAAINSGNSRAMETGLTRQLSSRQLQALNRQLPVPVPVPVPTPLPPVAAAVAAVFAAVAALLAAVLAGLNPFQAIFAVFIALVAIIIAILTPPNAKKQAPLIKKLVIKKTVLPFVIPIPYKQKEKEKEIIYKYVKEKKQHEQHKHHDEYEYKFDQVHSQKDDQDTIRSRKQLKGPNSWKKIENLVWEQDQLQNIIDSVTFGQDDTTALVRRIR